MHSKLAIYSGHWVSNNFRELRVDTKLIFSRKSIPMALSLLWDYKYRKKFVMVSSLSAILILIPTVAIDSYYYGKLVIASINIILYNVFSDHGPDLYGTEPLNFYLKNLFLNFNLVFPLITIAIPIYVRIQS